MVNLNSRMSAKVRSTFIEPFYLKKEGKKSGGESSSGGGSAEVYNHTIVRSFDKKCNCSCYLFRTFLVYTPNLLRPVSLWRPKTPFLGWGYGLGIRSEFNLGQV